jgi:hypothetical protein
VCVQAFWKDHGSELQTMFPLPVPNTLHTPLQKGAEHVEHMKARISPVLNESVMSMGAMLDCSVHIVVKDWPNFLLFKAEYQAMTSTDYYSHNTQFRRSDCQTLFLQVDRTHMFLATIAHSLQAKLFISPQCASA